MQQARDVLADSVEVLVTGLGSHGGGEEDEGLQNGYQGWKQTIKIAIHVTRQKRKSMTAYGVP